ncbi:MAG: hypothetical protein KDK11_07560, partial [Maritimibacter sp.]|nr:hypothetical protein [Maritimibacter sp.]
MREPAMSNWRIASATCARGVVPFDRKEHGIGMGGDDAGIGDEQDRRHVDHDHVVTLAQAGDQGGEAVGSEQVRGVGGAVPAGQHVGAECRDVL